MKFKLTAAVKICLLLLVACLGYLYFSGAFEGLTGKAAVFTQLKENEEISNTGSARIKKTDGTWQSMTGILPGKVADVKSKCIATKEFSWFNDTARGGGPYDSRGKLCGEETTLTTDDAKIKPAITAAGKMHCALDYGYSTTKFKGICHSDSDTAPSDKNSYKNYYKVASSK